MTAFRFDGRDVNFEPGQTVGAALIATGVFSWRTTRRHSRPRGYFCGIGVCFDCLITVEGVPNLQACLVLAEPAMVVASQIGTGHDDLS
jgi:hypothetical protein